MALVHHQFAWRRTSSRMAWTNTLATQLTDCKSSSVSQVWLLWYAETIMSLIYSQVYFSLTAVNWQQDWVTNEDWKIYLLTIHKRPSRPHTPYICSEHGIPFPFIIVCILQNAWYAEIKTNRPETRLASVEEIQEAVLVAAIAHRRALDSARKGDINEALFYRLLVPNQ